MTPASRWTRRASAPTRRHAAARSGRTGRGFFGGRSMISVDEPDHRRLRSLVSRAFTPRYIESLRPRIQALAGGALLDRVQPQGAMNLVADFAYPLPINVISDMLGVPADERDQLRAWSEAIAGGAAGESHPGRFAKLGAFGEYTARLVAEKRRGPQDDLVSQLAQIEEAGDRLDEDELLAMVGLLIFAGHETTSNLDRERHAPRCSTTRRTGAALRTDPSLIPAAVEELLRYCRARDVARAALRHGGHDARREAVRRGDALMVVLASGRPRRGAVQRPGRIWRSPARSTATSPSGRASTLPGRAAGPPRRPDRLRHAAAPAAGPAPGHPARGCPLARRPEPTRPRRPAGHVRPPPCAEALAAPGDPWYAGAREAIAAQAEGRKQPCSRDATRRRFGTRGTCWRRGCSAPTRSTGLARPLHGAAPTTARILAEPISSASTPGQPRPAAPLSAHDPHAPLGRDLLRWMIDARLNACMTGAAGPRAVRRADDALLQAARRARPGAAPGPLLPARPAGHLHGGLDGAGRLRRGERLHAGRARQPRLAGALHRRRPTPRVSFTDVTVPLPPGQAVAAGADGRRATCCSSTAPWSTAASPTPAATASAAR